MPRFVVKLFLLIIIFENYYLSSGYRETRNNYCTKIVREIEETVVPETKLEKETYKTFCWSSITLSCTRHRYKTVTVNKTITYTKTKRVKDCCPGYEKEGDSCIPMCRLGCGHGECIEPDVCLCDPGWREPLCIIECEPNRFGRGCKDNCSCLNGGKCDQETGYCYCPAGYKGDSCELPCPEGTYGEECKKQCECQNDATCDLVDGTCECTPGFEGEYCENPCKKGTHGENCEKLCICIPENTHLCDHVDGKCRCRPGYKGEYCEKQCDNMTYGPDCEKKCNCVNSEYCDHISGECYCQPGWIGARCSEECPYATFGDNCSSECSFQCLNNSGYCDHVTGDCICPPGVYGNLCDKECLPNYWGFNCSYLCLCTLNELCDAKNGTCYSLIENAVEINEGFFKQESSYVYISVVGVIVVIFIIVMYICLKTSFFASLYSLYNLKTRFLSGKISMPETTINNPIYDHPEVITETDENERNHIRGSNSTGVKFFKNNSYDGSTETKHSNVEKAKEVSEESTKNKRDSKDSDLRKSGILSDFSATFKEMKRCSMRKSDSTHSSTNQLGEDFEPEVLDDFNVFENIYEKSIEEKNENIYDLPKFKDTKNFTDKE